MKTRLVGLALAAGWLLQGSALAADPDSAQVADEWRGRRVLAASPQVVLRERPDAQAPAILVSLAGVWLDVKRSQGDWLEDEFGWMRAADAVRDEQAIEYFTAELARGETAFAYIARSRAWLKKKEFDKAQADVSEALRLEPNSARAYYARSAIAAAQGRKADELAACDCALAIDPRDSVALGARSGLRAEAGEYDRAIADLDLAIESLPRVSWLRSARGYCWGSKGEHDKAVADFTDAIQLDPLNAFALTLRAAIYLQRQELDKALQDAEQALRVDAKLARALGVRSSVRMQKGELDAALSDLDESIRLDATNPDAFYSRGSAHYLKGQYDAAVLDYTQAISLDPNDADSYGARAETWSKKGDAANAVIDLAQYLRLRPKDDNAYVQRGLLLLATDVDAALDDFNAVLEADPRNVEALLGRSQARQRKNDFAKAMLDATAAIVADPKNATAYIVRGWLQKKTDADAAIKDFDAALEIDPRHVGALFERADVWRKQGQPSKALADLTAAIEVNPKNSRAYRLRAELHSSQREHRLAVDDFTAALRIKPDDASLLLERSTQWSLCGETQKAIEDCQAALAIEPENLMAYHQMAQAHSMAGQRDQALDDFASALRIDPRDEETRLQRAYELFSQGKFDLAMADVDEVIRNGKRVADAYNWRGYFWMQRKERDKALADFNEAIRLEPDDPEHWRMRADCRYRMKQFDQAIQDADEALRLNPKSEPAAHVRRQALAAKQDPSKADEPDEAQANGDGTSVWGLAPEQLAASYLFVLRGSDGLKIAFETGVEGKFGPERDLFPVRLRLGPFEGLSVRFKLRVADEAAALYGQLESKRLPPQEIAFLRNANVSLTMTEADLEAARSGDDVTKFLVLRPHQDSNAEKPELEVVNSAELGPKSDVVAEAAKRGASVVTLQISKRLSAPRFLPRERGLDDMVAFCLRGPEGLTLIGETPSPGRFESQPTPLPAHLAVESVASLGSTPPLRFKLGGPLVAEKSPIYALVTLPRLPSRQAAWLGQVELQISFSKEDLDAALAGNAVTCVVYLPEQAEDGGQPRLQTLSSARLEPGKDPVAAARGRGAIVAVLKLSKQLAELAPLPFDRAEEPCSAAEQPASDDSAAREPLER
ncbi:MAG TPA: tetratricopeptide repeat protein [Pirellulales bacterium]|nr:tetratricopeptide repeat protein [Pirellulales bacterium]